MGGHGDVWRSVKGTGRVGAGGERRAQLLPKAALEVRRLADANEAAPSGAVLQSLRWHPNAQLLVTARIPAGS